MERRPDRTKKKKAFLGLSGLLKTNLDLIERHTFSLSPEAPPVVAIRIRRRKVRTPGEPSKIVLIDQPSLISWLEEGGSPSFWIMNGKSVCAKLGNPVSRTVSVARFVADCRRGQSIGYVNGNHFDLRRSNLKPERSVSRGLLPRVKDALAEYRDSAKSVIAERDLGFFLVPQERIDLSSFIEKL